MKTGNPSSDLVLGGRPIRRGDSVRVWHGLDFIRSGTVIGLDHQNREVLVEYDYDIPNEWVKVSKLC